MALQVAGRIHPPTRLCLRQLHQCYETISEHRTSTAGTIVTAMFFITRLVPRRRDGFRMQQDDDVESDMESVPIKEEVVDYHAN